MANSLVGSMIMNFTYWLFSNSLVSLILCRTGREKAKVFPDPVLSLAMMSFPSSMALKVRYWIGNSALTPFLLSASFRPESLMKLLISPCSCLTTYPSSRLYIFDIRWSSSSSSAVLFMILLSTVDLLYVIRGTIWTNEHILTKLLQLMSGTSPSRTRKSSCLR